MIGTCPIPSLCVWWRVWGNVHVRVCVEGVSVCGGWELGDVRVCGGGWELGDVRVCGGGWELGDVGCVVEGGS